jgi:hypothetical protein
MGWQRIETAPFDRDLELAVLDADGPHVLVFPAAAPHCKPMFPIGNTVAAPCLHVAIVQPCTKVH